MSKPFKPTTATLISLLLAAMPSLLGTAAVAPVLPLISEAFPEVSDTVVSLILTLPPLATVAAGFFIGGLSDKIGRVKVLVVSLFLFAVAGVSGFFLNDIYAIIAFRLILGVGIAGLIPMVSALITEYYQEPLRTKYFGYQSASFGIGAFILQTGSGALANISWKAPFLIYLFGFLVIPFVLLFVREPEHTKGVVDKSDDPKDSVKLPIKTYLLIYGTLIVIAVLTYIHTVKLSYYIADFMTLPPTEVGLILGMIGLFSAIAGIVFWRIAGRFNVMQIFGLVFLVEGIGLLLVGLTQNLIIIGIGTALIGFGLGLATPNGTRWVSQITPHRALGTMMGGVTISLFIGLFASTFAAPALLSVTGSYVHMFLACGGIGLVFALIYLAVGHVKREKSTV